MACANLVQLRSSQFSHSLLIILLQESSTRIRYHRRFSFFLKHYFAVKLETRRINSHALVHHAQISLSLSELEEVGLTQAHAFQHRLALVNRHLR